LARHICIWGEPGIGKTRLVYEATCPEDISSSVAYFQSPKAFEQSEIIDELVHDTSKSAIVVVDECESRDRESIWRQLKSLGTSSQLVLPAWRFASDAGLSTEPWRPLAEEAIAKQRNFYFSLIG
jgi:hypothetical protein